MRRVFFMIFAVLAAASVVSFSTLSAHAQPADQYEASDGAQAAPDTPESTSETTASEPAAEEKVPEPPAKPDPYTAEGLDQRVVNSVASDPYSQVVDNATKGRFAAPGWKQVKDPGAYGGTALVGTTRTKNHATYKVKVPEDGYYTLYALWPGGAKNSTARFGVQTQDGLKWEEVDQTLDAGNWVRVGSFRMVAGDENSVRVSPFKGAVADAVMISKNVLVGANAQMVSVGDPDQLSGQSAAPSGDSARTADLSRAGGSPIVRTARRHLGKPYDYGHAVCRPRMAREDCSCLTRNVFLPHGWRLVDSPVTQYYRYGTRVLKSRLVPGDLVFHDLNKDGDLRDAYTDHVAIWSGNGNIIHASSYFGEVVESKERYLKNYWGAKRLRPR